MFVESVLPPKKTNNHNKTHLKWKHYITKNQKLISSNPNHQHCNTSSCRHRKPSSATTSANHSKPFSGDRRLVDATTSNSNNNSKTNPNMPSRWYTVLALPFPDQKLGRRDINTFGRGVYSSRAGFFSNPLWFELKTESNACHLSLNTTTRTSQDSQM